MFCDIARCRGFSQAAAVQQPPLTQSAASQIVHQLEKRLGVQLIDRSTMPLTPLGQAYHQGCKQLVERYYNFCISWRPDPFGRNRLPASVGRRKNGRGTGPSALECLLITCHAGVSTDGGATIYGFNPDGGRVPVWHLMDRLKNGDAFSGVVRDDTTVFSAARTHGRTVYSFEIILPEPRFLAFRTSRGDLTESGKTVSISMVSRKETATS